MWWHVFLILMIAQWRNRIRVTWKENAFTTLFGIVAFFVCFFSHQVLFDTFHTYLYQQMSAMTKYLNTQIQLTGNLASTRGRRNTILCFVRQLRAFTDPDLHCWCVLCLSSKPPFLPLHFFSFLFFFFFSWHKSGRWKCHGAGSFCKEVLIAMLV